MPYRSVTGRAILALAFLLGFYVLAFGAVAALVGANVALFAVAGRTQFQLVVLTAFVTWAVLRGVFFLSRHDDADLPGFAVDEATQPELVRLVAAVAAEMATSPPARVLLVPEVNASVTQTGGMLGLRAGQRVMTIGMGLLDAVSVDQLRAVVAHELGHYAGGDTRLGPLVYRAGASIYRTVGHLGEGSVLGRLFAAYGRRYLVLSQRVRRHQELSADAAAVRLAGRDSLVSGLRRIATTAAAFDHLVGTYLAPLWRRGCEAENAFEGYRALLADPARHQELLVVEEVLRARPTDPYDSHPSLAERITHAADLPDRPQPERDRRPAWELLTQAEGVERQLSRLLTRQLTGQQMERVVTWDAAGEMFGADVVDDAEAVMRAAAQVTGNADSATLETVIALVEAGRGPELAAAVTGGLERLPEERREEVASAVLRHYLGCALGAYLAAQRGHAWSVSWSGPLQLVDSNGEVTDPFTLAESLLEEPGFGPRLREVLGDAANLRRFAASAGPDGADGERARVVDVVPDVKVKGKRADLVVSTAALIFHPIAQTWGYRWRLFLSEQGVSSPARNAARQRLRELFSRPPEEVLGGVAGVEVVPLLSVRGYRPRWIDAVHVRLAGSSGETTVRIRCGDKSTRDSLVGLLGQVHGRL
ncbi:MAG TPA: M48 family metalloprotease [Acidimicrobiales bacterium]|nr:M48 family metalloprotease [Acidimicrobiales bacterium]